MGKYGKRLQSIMRTLKYLDLRSLRKGVLGYPTSFTNTCFFVCLFFACLSGLLFYRVLHCIHFFYLQGVGGGGYDTTTRRTKRAQGRSRGEWGYAPWEILKLSLSVCKCNFWVLRAV